MKKKIIIASLVVCVLLLAVAGYVYHRIYSPFFSIEENTYVYIDERKDYDDLLRQLKEAKIKDVRLFDQLAKKMDYPEKMKTGRYEIQPTMDCMDLYRMLVRGAQSPCRITFNNIRLKSDLEERIGSQLMFGEEGLKEMLDDPAVCASYGMDTTTILCLFIPNTYEVYWNVSADRFLALMKKEYDRFWNEDRLAKAKAIPLTPVQVSILASIVEEETAARSEYPIVAGLYINRLKSNMLLQADPTLKFAVGDFSLKRILNVHKQVDSPYNTYQHTGLPPGPLRTPSIPAIDGVLNYYRSNYLYMCAKEDFSGKHNFATTLSEHNLNAKKYHDALNRNNIR